MGTLLQPIISWRFETQTIASKSSRTPEKRRVAKRRASSSTFRCDLFYLAGLPMNSRFANLFSTGLVAATFLAGSVPARTATFVWANNGGNWNVPANWGGTVPSGTDPTDILVFGGDVLNAYISTNNLPPVPALFNQLTFNASNGANVANTHSLNGARIALGGIAPQIAQNNVGRFTLDLPIELRAPLTLTGNGSNVTMNGAISGPFNITKNGSST